MGLTVSKNLAQAMGGDIKVNSTLGVGTLFTVTLPLRKANNPLPPNHRTSINQVDPDDIAILLSTQNSNNQLPYFANP